MTIERHPFQFFLAGLADKLKGEEDMSITRVHWINDDYLDMTVDEIVAAAQEGIVILESRNFEEPDYFEGIFYLGCCFFNESEDCYWVCFMGFEGNFIEGSPVLEGIVCAASDTTEYPMIVG